MKYYISICIVILFVNVGFAQENKISLETRIGVSTIFNSPALSPNIKENIGVVILRSIPIKKNLYIQTGLGYDLSGYRYSEDWDIVESTGSYTTKISKHYLTIPINLKISGIGKKQESSFQVGLFYSYMVAQIAKTKGYIDWRDERPDTDLNNWENDTDVLPKRDRHDFGIEIGFSKKILSIESFNLELGGYSKVGLLPTQANPGSLNISGGLSILLIRKK